MAVWTMQRLTGMLTAGLMALMVSIPAGAQDEPGSTQASAPVTIVGSDTLGEAVEAWAAAFSAQNDGIAFDITSEGSGTAPPALTAGEAQIAPMSREMTKGEINTFRDAFGYRPTAITVGLDALAVYVHKDNPVSGLTMGQLDRIFSSTHLCGGENITRWDQVALGTRTVGDMVLHSRNELSGTYDFFRTTALCGGDFKRTTTLHEDSRHVVEAVAADINAIGYSGLGYQTDGVKALAIGEGDDPYSARYFPIVVERFADSDDPARRHAYVVDGRYPLSRPLFLYVNKAPGEALPASVTAFLTFVLSDEGQAILEEIGYVPLPSEGLRDEQAKLAADYRPRRWWFFE